MHSFLQRLELGLVLQYSINMQEEGVMRGLTIPSDAAAAEQEFAAALDKILAVQFKDARVIGTALIMPEVSHGSFNTSVVLDFAAQRMTQISTTRGDRGTPLTTVVTPFAELEKSGAGDYVAAAKKAFMKKLNL